MKKSIVIKATKITPKINLKPDFKSMVLFSLVICGVILGLACAGKFSSGANSFIPTVLGSYAASCKELGVIKLILNYFLFSIFPVLIVFILGFCAVGVPLIWLTTVIYGFFCGVVIGCLFIENGILGLVYAICINIPCYAITAASLIRCCCESTKSSVCLFGCFCGQAIPNKGNSALKEYCLYFLVMTIPILVASIVKAISFTLFSGFFSFI